MHRGANILLKEEQKPPRLAGFHMRWNNPRLSLSKKAPLLIPTWTVLTLSRGRLARLRVEKRVALSPAGIDPAIQKEQAAGLSQARSPFWSIGGVRRRNNGNNGCTFLVGTERAQT